MKALIVTSRFPFLPGEEFLETEIDHWALSPFREIIIAPEEASGPARPTPSSIVVDPSLSTTNRKLRWLLKALFSRYLIREIQNLLALSRFSFETLVEGIREIALLLKAQEGLAKMIERHAGIDVVYTYWNLFASYAACTLKEKGLVRSVVSRIHRGDLCEEQFPGGLITLKRQIVNDFDRVFVLGDGAASYAKATFGFSAQSLQSHLLGVELSSVLAEPSAEERVRIVSVSYCVPVKRVDRIIAGIASLAETRSGELIHWTHIGGGDLFDELKESANRQLGDKPNVSFEVLGDVSNEEVGPFYSENPVDFFVNVSESEGMPVSIMEAMSAGVPVIAPNVGGVSELV